MYSVCEEDGVCRGGDMRDEMRGDEVFEGDLEVLKTRKLE